MTKRRKSRWSTFNQQKIIRQIRQGVRYIWNQTLIFNIVMFAIVALLFWTLLSRAFVEIFNCTYLITQGLQLDNVVCTGATISGTGDIVSFFGGSSSDVGIPGLAEAIDGPLNSVRRLILWLVLLFFMLFSGFLTYIINNVKKVVRLLTFNKREWAHLLSSLRVFVTILVALVGLFFVYVMF